MTMQALLNECLESGVTVRLDDGTIKLRGKQDAVRAATARLHPHKTELLAHLRACEPIDLVREFMAVDGLTLDEAEAMAAISVQPRTAGEWLALIAELDATIEEYCLAVGMTKEGKAAIFATRRKQSVASIPGSLTWFRRELMRLTPPRPAA